MKRTSSLLGAVLSAALLLASCDTTPKTGGGTDNGGNTNPGGTTPIGNGITATVYRAVTLGTGFSGDAEVRISGTTSRTATASVQSAPAGLTVTVGSVAALSSGDLSLPITVTGTVQSSDVIKLTVTVDSSSASLEIPVKSFKSVPIAATGLSSPYSVASLRFQPGGTVLLSGGIGGNSVDRGNLVKFDPNSGAFSLIPMGLKYGSEAITSQTTAPDGTIWATVRGITAKGGYLVSRDASGTIQTYYPDAAGDNISNLTTTADGRIWFTQYTRAAVKALTPSTGSVQSYPVTEQADSLIRGADGKLYYAAFYARPAIVQLDPATGQSKSFDVGQAGRSLPISLTAASDGSIWFIEARSGAVLQLDPLKSTQTQFPLPTGARPNEIAITPSGQVWVSDTTVANPALYTTFTTSAGKSVLVGYRTPTGSTPNALQVGPDGKLWYVAGGQLVTEQ